MPFAPRARGTPGASALRALVYLSLALQPACSSHGGGGDPAKPGASSLETRALPCDVATVLGDHCVQCHSSPPKFGAPMPLVTYDDLLAPRTGGRAIDVALQRVTAVSSRMPPPPNAPLTAADVGALEAWVKGGALPSTSACEAGAPAPTSTQPTLSCTPDTHLRGTVAYTTTATSPLDDYECFGVDIDAAARRHVTAIAPRIDNTKIVHHVLLLLADDSYPTTPTPCASGLSNDWRLVSAWAPGTQALELPAVAGFPIGSGTTHWIIQVHYNNAQAIVGAVDQSGFDLCTTDVLRPYDAGVVAFGGMNIDLPPHASRTLDCHYALPQAFEGAVFFNAMPHMHKLGVALSTSVTHAGAAAQTLVNQPSFSFNEQYLFPSSLGVHAGDDVETRCTWNNSTDTEVRFGEGTGDEMCFDFGAYYPLVPDQNDPHLPFFNWGTPSLGATCTLE